ncbi:hypothetical protein J4219_04415 [Candidatus Woesearchaeota archaeon]|nr:hypothetical protein [Candidatus Woesearchaeota archaeon]
MPKILIGIPTYGKQRYCLDLLIDCIKKQTVKADVIFIVNHGESAYATLIRSKGFEAVEAPEPSKTRIGNIVNNRKYLRQYALKKGYDYLLFLDSDIMLPARAIEFLLQTKADVASGAYLSVFQIEGKEVIAPVLYKDLGGGDCQQYTYEGVAQPKLIDIGAAGLGCVLISRKVLEKVDIRTFGKSSTGGEDIAFFVDARANGFKCVAYTGVKCLHMPYPLTDERAKLFEWKTRVKDFNYELKM